MSDAADQAQIDGTLRASQERSDAIEADLAGEVMREARAAAEVA